MYCTFLKAKQISSVVYLTNFIFLICVTSFQPSLNITEDKSEPNYILNREHNKPVGMKGEVDY